ncbi:MAG: nucleotidyltransferase family protein [Planctomycetota bacterium]
MTSAPNSLPRVFAIVPAAGRSRRMGQAKQLLDVGGQPLLLATLRPLSAAEIVGLVLVTHRAIAEQLGAALPPAAILVRNDDEHSEMIDSVRIGLRTWQARASVHEHDGILVCPADQPGIQTADFDACIHAFRRMPDGIVIAARAGRRGHPQIFPAALADFVLSDACAAGLHALPRCFPDRVQLVPCESREVVEDVDTPADCRRWLKHRDRP